jgi:hypothetical protein
MDYDHGLCGATDCLDHWDENDYLALDPQKGAIRATLKGKFLEMR